MSSFESESISKSQQKALECRTPEWYLVSILYALDSLDELRESIITQECIYLIKASSATEAYTKSIEWASPRQFVPVESGKPIELPLLGITEIMPIWESLEHGSELGYRQGVCESLCELKKSILRIEDLQ